MFQDAIPKQDVTRTNSAHHIGIVFSQQLAHRLIRFNTKNANRKGTQYPVAVSFFSSGRTLFSCAAQSPGCISPCCCCFIPVEVFHPSLLMNGSADCVWRGENTLPPSLWPDQYRYVLLLMASTFKFSSSSFLFSFRSATGPHLWTIESACSGWPKLKLTSPKRPFGSV